MHAPSRRYVLYTCLYTCVYTSLWLERETKERGKM